MLYKYDKKLRLPTAFIRKQSHCCGSQTYGQASITHVAESDHAYIAFRLQIVLETA